MELALPPAAGFGPAPQCDKQLNVTTATETVSHFRFWGGWRVPRRETRIRIMISGLLRVVSISMFLALCLKSLQSTDLGIQKNPVFSSVWLLVHSSQAGVPYHYAHTPLKTDTRQKISGDRTVVHMYRHDENTEARSQARALTTLRLSDDELMLNVLRCQLTY